MPPAAVPQLSPAALEVARRLVSRSVPPEADDAVTLAAVERLCLTVPNGLSRWFGPYGSRALVARALARARIGHPALALVTILDESPCVTGLRESAAKFGSKATSEGVIALFAALTEQIGRLIGDDLVANLIEQSGTRILADGSASSSGPVAAASPPPADPVAAADDDIQRTAETS